MRSYRNTRTGADDKAFQPTLEELESLRKSSEDLLSPLVHYSFERSAELVRATINVARKLKFTDLLSAATCCLTKMEEHSYDFSRNQFAVNMYERSRWIDNEVRAALGEKVDRQILRSQRRDLFCEPYELAPLNHYQGREAGKRLAVGTFRRELRCIRSELSALRQVFNRADSSEQLGLLRRAGERLELSVGSMLYALAQAEKKTSVKPSLYAARPALEEFFSDLRAGKATQALIRLEARMEELEVESRIAFGRDLGSTVSEEAHRQVSVHEDAGTDLNATIEAVQGMMSEWLIDKSISQPQYGFGRTCTHAELESYLTTFNGRLFRAVMENREVGYYLLFTRAQDFPPEVAAIMSEIERAGEYTDVVSGWLHLVGVTRSGRELAYERNVDLYSILHEAAIDTFSTYQVEKAFAVVREGDLANLAKPSHIKRGWRETGVMLKLGEFPYQGIRIDLCPGANWNW